MSLALEIIIPFGVFLVLCIAVPIGITFQQVNKMRQGVHLKRIPEEAVGEIYQMFRPEGDWAVEKGFEQFEGLFAFALGATAIVAAWRHREHPTYFVSLRVGKQKSYVLITEFSTDLDLSTGDNKQLQLFPHPPGHYMQTFSKLSRDQLLDQHLAAARYITNLGKVEVKQVPHGFEEAFTQGEATQAAYLQSLLLWPLRAPYWFFVRKSLVHNKTVEQLHKSRRITLPGDTGFQDCARRM